VHAVIPKISQEASLGKQFVDYGLLGAGGLTEKVYIGFSPSNPASLPMRDSQAFTCASSAFTSERSAPSLRNELGCHRIVRFLEARERELDKRCPGLASCIQIPLGPRDLAVCVSAHVGHHESRELENAQRARRVPAFLRARRRPRARAAQTATGPDRQGISFGSVGASASLANLSDPVAADGL
jgi:hypothetical protein